MASSKDFINILIAESDEKYLQVLRSALSGPMRGKTIGLSFASNHKDFLKAVSADERVDVVFVSTSFLDSISAGYDSAGMSDAFRGREVVVIACEKEAGRAEKFIGAGALDCLIRESDAERSIRRVMNYIILRFEMRAALAEKTSAGIIIVSGAKIAYVNPAALAMGGYSREESIGRDFMDFVHPQFRGEVAERMKHFGAPADSPVEMELMFISGSGEPRWVSSSSSMIEYMGAPAVLITAIDITSRKRSEEMLSLDESRLEALLELAQMTGATLKEITDFTLDQAVKLTGSTIGYLAFTNDDESVLTMFSWSKQVMVDCNIPGMNFIFQADRTGLWGEALRQRKPVITNDYAAPNPLKKGYPEGHVKITRHMNIPIFEGDRIVAIAGVGNKSEDYNASDLRQLTLLMTEMWRIIRRGQDAAELRARTTELQQLFKALPDIYFRVSADGIINDYKVGNAGDLYVPPEAFVGKSHREVVPPDVADRFDEAYEKVRATGAAPPVEYDLDIKGKTNHFEARIVPYQNDQLIVLIRNISERKNAEAAIREAEVKLKEELEEKIITRTLEIQEANARLQQEILEREKAERELALNEKRFRALAQNSTDMILILGADGAITYSSPSVESWIGYRPDALTGRNAYEFVHPDEHRVLVKNIKRCLENPGLNIDISHRVKRADGGYSCVEGVIRNLIEVEGIGGIVANIRDVTVRKRLQEDIIRTSKLESLGILAGGIAHDFNNILMGIIGNVALAKKKVEPGGKTHEILIRAENIAYRAKTLTEQLITFSRGGMPITRVVRINDLVSDVSRFAASGSNVSCRFRLAPDLWAADIDEGQIAQVMTNLVINSKQAMPDGGVLEVATENVTIDDTPEEGGRKNFIRITVRDHGHGISEENLSRIFDPYFSTKPNGSGLGLSTTYSIIKNHGGSISVSSAVGAGTTFLIDIPAVTDREPSEPPSDLMFEEDLRGLRVLIMDDDETVIVPLYEMLMEFGIKVSVARNGEEAIGIYRQNMETGRPIDLVIMDLVVKGGLGGVETIGRLRQIDPNVRAIVSSGYSSDPLMADYRKYGFAGVLNKPYKQDELSKLINSIVTRRVGDV